MRALSLWQPHAAAIALELKPWETRSAVHWSTSYRGPLAIHAAKRPWNEGDEWHQLAGAALGCRIVELIVKAFPDIDEDQRKRANVALRDRVLVFGAVVCVVDLVDCSPTSKLRGKISAEHEFWGDFSDGEDGRGRVAFKLENMRLLAAPLPWRGMQGWFDVALDGEPSREAPIPEQMGLFGGSK